MPLPRFDRLAPEVRAAILAVARSHFARDGRDGASFNRIIADAGISKTSAYHYFDGKDDLFAAVAADTEARVVAVLGAWQPVDAADELWDQLATGTGRLMEHLREHPDDRAVLAAAAPGTGQDDPWIAAMVADGVRIGLIDAGPGLELITAATAAVIGVADARELRQPEAVELRQAETGGLRQAEAGGLRQPETGGLRQGGAGGLGQGEAGGLCQSGVGGPSRAGGREVRPAGGHGELRVLLERLWAVRR
jgi:TetR/AcrR family transcriptional regulator of autoinduction and epiphytic fitness